MPGAERLECADRPRGRSRHRRLRHFLLRSRYVLGSGRRRDPPIAELFRHARRKVEARNQARVHLWYPQKHGLPYPALESSTQGIDRFLTKNTQVGIRRTQAGHDVYAPNGFDDIEGLIVRPHPGPNFPLIAMTARQDGYYLTT